MAQMGFRTEALCATMCYYFFLTNPWAKQMHNYVYNLITNHLFVQQQRVPYIMMVALAELVSEYGHHYISCTNVA